MDNEKGIWQVCMDGRKENDSQDQRWKRMMNGRWKYRGSVCNFCMDGACPQYRVQVEEEK